MVKSQFHCLRKKTCELFIPIPRQKLSGSAQECNSRVPRRTRNPPGFAPCSSHSTRMRTAVKMKISFFHHLPGTEGAKKYASEKMEAINCSWHSARLVHHLGINKNVLNFSARQQAVCFERAFIFYQRQNLNRLSFVTWLVPREGIELQRAQTTSISGFKPDPSFPVYAG